MIWIIIFAIILFFAAVLLIPISVHISFDKRLEFNVNILSFKIFKHSDTENGNKAKNDSKNKKSFVEKLDMVSSYLKFVKEFLTIFNEYSKKAIVIRKYDFYFSCGLGDAAKTGMFFGAVYAVLNSFHTYLFNNYKIKRKKVLINPDFENERFDLVFLLSFRISLFWILFLLYKQRKVIDKINNIIKKDGV